MFVELRCVYFFLVPASLVIGRLVYEILRVDQESKFHCVNQNSASFTLEDALLTKIDNNSASDCYVLLVRLRLIYC